MDKLALLKAGRLSQACPDCGTTEAAGYFCSKCLRRMGPDDWAAQEGKSQAGRLRAHDRAESGAHKLVGPESEALA